MFSVLIATMGAPHPRGGGEVFTAWISVPFQILPLPGVELPTPGTRDTVLPLVPGQVFLSDSAVALGPWSRAPKALFVWKIFRSCGDKVAWVTLTLTVPHPSGDFII